MIKAVFITQSGRLKGFSISGHADYDTSGKDIVCAAVSAVSIMTANTITEIHKAKAEIKSDDAKIKLCLKQENKESESLIEGMFMFLNELSQQYPQHLKLSTQKGVSHND